MTRDMGGVCAGYRIPRKVLLTGLRNSGKTTLLYYWCLNKQTETIPTESFNVELATVSSSCQLLVWDVTDPVRRRQFYHGTEALVYVIDNSDSDRVSDVCADIRALLEDRDLKHLPLLLVLSKLDISESSLSSEVEKRLADYLVTDRHYTWAEVRKDDIQTYNAALQKLCQLMFT